MCTKMAPDIIADAVLLESYGALAPFYLNSPTVAKLCPKNSSITQESLISQFCGEEVFQLLISV